MLTVVGGKGIVPGVTGQLVDFFTQEWANLSLTESLCREFSTLSRLNSVQGSGINALACTRYNVAGLSGLLRRNKCLMGRKKKQLGLERCED